MTTGTTTTSGTSNSNKEESKGRTMTKQELMSLIKDGMIVSKDINEHFERITPTMSEIGAERIGSEAMDGPDGRRIIVDKFILNPEQTVVLAGYPRSESPTNPFAPGGLLADQ
jgi:NAD(P)H-nitrite reductase large subunit